MRLRLFAMLLAIAALAGCAAAVTKGPAESAAAIRVPLAANGLLVLHLSGSPKTTGAPDWSGFKEEWREAFAEQKQAYNTSSSAWEGVFSAMTNEQVEAIAVDVVKQIRRR